ncbi:MAG: ABC transporter permease [Janthinobacterium lividum]
MTTTWKPTPQQSALAIAGLAILAVGWSVPNFLSLDNVMQVLRQMSVAAIIAIGVTFVVITGRLDISVGALMSCCAIAAVEVHNSVGPAAAIAVALAIGFAVGCINGALVGWLGLNSLIATLGVLSVLQGATLVYTAGSNAQVAGAASSWFTFIGRGYVCGIPTPVLIAATLLALFSVVLTRTTFGRRVFAVGGNSTASAYAAISAPWAIFLSYIIADVLTGVAGIVYSSRVAAARSDSGNGLELMVLSAIILGGTSLLGGSGSVMRSIVGILIIGFVQNALLLVGSPYYVQWIVTALIIVGAVWTDLGLKRGRVFA